MCHCAGMDGALPSVVARLVSVPSWLPRQALAAAARTDHAMRFRHARFLRSCRWSCQHSDNGFGGVFKIVHNIADARQPDTFDWYESQVMKGFSKLLGTCCPEEIFRV